MSEEERKEVQADKARVKAAIASLGEHFDTVQIFVTRDRGGGMDDGVTVNCAMGTGNWFARYGQVAVWMQRQQAYEAKSIHEEPPSQ